MPICKRSLQVACRVSEAFEHVADWNNFRDFMPMLLNVRPISFVSYGPGTSLEASVVLARIEVDTTLDLVEFVKDRRILYKSARGIKSKISWDFSELEGKTLITYSFEFEIPPGLVTKGSELESIEKDMQERVNESTQLLKWVLETQAKSKKE
jgi:hypothetical protein